MSAMTRPIRHQYEDFMRHVFEHGVTKSDRTGTGTRSVFGHQMRFDLREGWRNGIKNVITNAIEADWRKGNWTANARASYSTAKHRFKDTDDGFFQSTTMNGSALPNTGIGAGYGLGETEWD